MDNKFKNKTRNSKDLGRQSLYFIPDILKVNDQNSKNVQLKGSETTRSYNHPALKKTLSHFTIDLQNMDFKGKPIKPLLSENSSKIEILTRRLSLPAKLQISPVVLPQVTSKFLINLNKTEQKLKLFYLNENFI